MVAFEKQTSAHPVRPFMGRSNLFCCKMTSRSVSTTDVSGTGVSVEKSLDLPGFSSDIVMVSTKSLQRDFNWTQNDLQWLQKNWIRLDKKSKDGDSIFVKPYEHKKEPLKGSHEDYDALSLQDIIKNRRHKTSTQV